MLDTVSIGSKYNISIWDAMIVQAAVSINARVIWTEDLNSRQLYAGVEARNPFQASYLY